MNTVVLFGSPRKNGNTMAYTRELLGEELTEAQMIFAYDLSCRPCIGCNACAPEPHSCIYSDIDPVLNKISSADCLIIASPIYNFGVPSPLKSFFDRLQPLYEKYGAKGSPTGKEGEIVITCGHSGSVSLQAVTRQCELAMRLLGFKNTRTSVKTDTDLNPHSINIF